MNNYEGSSKGIEEYAALELVKQAYCKRGVIAGFIIADNDSSMKALLRHSYEDSQANDASFVWPQKPSITGKLGAKLSDT
eukprot:6478560-Ditylum_brightwellii.AAC.1